MNFRELLRKIETPVTIVFISIWLLTYLLSRFFLEMSTYESPTKLIMWIAIFMSPFIIYCMLRASFANGAKWYIFICYLLLFTALISFTCEYMVLNGDILWSATTKKETVKRVKLLNVRKVFKRKAGFDHTEVTILNDGKPLTLEARRYAYFYLEHKNSIEISIGKSDLGNYYVTHIRLADGEKTRARWHYFEDWAYRYRYFGAILFIFAIGIWIAIKYFPKKTDEKPVKIGFWKLFGILMGMLLGIGVLLYAGLWIYMHYFRT